MSAFTLPNDDIGAMQVHECGRTLLNVSVEGVLSVPTVRVALLASLRVGNGALSAVHAVLLPRSKGTNSSVIG